MLLPYMCYHIALGQAVWAQVVVQKIGEAGARLLWDGAWLTPEKHAPAPRLLCYHTKFHRSRSDHLSGVPKIWGYAGAPPLGSGCTCPSPRNTVRYDNTCVIVPDFAALGQNVWAQVGKSQKLEQSWGSAPWEGSVDGILET